MTAAARVAIAVEVHDARVVALGAVDVQDARVVEVHDARVVALGGGDRLFRLARAWSQPAADAR